MIQNITIRVMTAADINDVSKVFVKEFNRLGKNWSEKTSMQHVKETFVGEAHWVAVHRGRIIGFLMGGLLTTDNGKELFLDTFAVSQKFQQKGVGSLLWQEAENYAVKHNLVGIRLFANPNTASYRWYRKMGFKESGWVDLFKKV